eukprot:2160265-Rhodomonas_salina.1
MNEIKRAEQKVHKRIERELEEAKLVIKTMSEATEQDQRQMKRARTEEASSKRQVLNSEIAERFANGVSATELAAEYGLSARHIRDIASKVKCK